MIGEDRSPLDACSDATSYSGSQRPTVDKGEELKHGELLFRTVETHELI